MSRGIIRNRVKPGQDRRGSRNGGHLPRPVLDAWSIGLFGMADRNAAILLGRACSFELTSIRDERHITQIFAKTASLVFG